MSNQGFNQYPNNGGPNNFNQGFNPQYNANGYGFGNPNSQMGGQYGGNQFNPNPNQFNNTNPNNPSPQAQPQNNDAASQQQQLIDLQNKINAEHQKTVMMQQQAQI